MRASKLFQTAVLFLFVGTPSFAQTALPLIRLTKQAISPQMAYKRGVQVVGRERNLEGWLVLNGARFRNSEYPDLAKHLAQAYAQNGYTSPDPEFTQLTLEPSETDSHGQIVQGIAICPTRALCGDFVGELMWFDLSSSL